MQKKSSLTVIFLTVFIDLLGFGILIPILPAFAGKELGISDFGIGLIVAIFSLVQFFFNPILGKISDKYGRRPFILGPLLITSVSYLIFSFSDSFALLFFSRFLAGFGGSNIGVAQAYMADVTDKSNRSKGMGLIGAAFGLGFVFGPLIGGLLSEYGYEMAGFASSGFSFLAFVFAYFLLPESLKRKEADSKLKLQFFDLQFTKKVFTMPRVGLLVTLFFIIVFSMANIYGTFAILGYRHYNFSDAQNGYLFGIIGIIGAAIQGGFIKKLSDKFDDKTLVLSGTFFMMIGLGMIPYGGNFLGVAVVISILAAGLGILQPTVLSMISKFAPDHQQGSILGINQSFASLARVFGPIWGGFSFEYLGYEFPFLTGALFTLFTFLISLFFLNSNYVVKDNY